MAPRWDLACCACARCKMLLGIRGGPVRSSPGMLLPCCSTIPSCTQDRQDLVFLHLPVILLLKYSSCRSVFWVFFLTTPKWSV